MSAFTTFDYPACIMVFVFMLLPLLFLKLQSWIALKCLFKDLILMFCSIKMETCFDLYVNLDLLSCIKVKFLDCLKVKFLEQKSLFVGAGQAEPGFRSSILTCLICLSWDLIRFWIYPNQLPDSRNFWIICTKFWSKKQKCHLGVVRDRVSRN